MSPLNEDQLSQIRDERKEQILAAAVKVFARRGIVGTRMSMIAEEAGLSHGLLYHYFKSKDELFTTIIQRAMEEAFSALGEVSAIPGTPIEKLTTLTRVILDEENAAIFMLIHQARTSEAAPAEVKRLIEMYSMQAFIEQLLPLFKEGQEAGVVLPGDLPELISSYLTILSGLMVLHSQGVPGYPVPRVELLMRFITAKS